MRPSKPLILTVLSMVLLQIVGCTSFGPISEPLPSHRPSSEEGKKPVIKVETLDGRHLKLFSGWMNSEEVGGFWAKNRDLLMVIPIPQVRSIEVGRFSWTRTALSLASGAFLVHLLIGLRDSEIFPSMEGAWDLNP